MNSQYTYRNASIAIVIHLLLLNICFFVLMGVFEFPGILRASSEHRLDVFCSNRQTIVPVYYLLAISGFTQIIVAVLTAEVLTTPSPTRKLALVFGTATGFFQSLGFIRWVVVIPALCESLSGTVENMPARETVFLVENAFNRYVGMSVGEHLGFIAQAAWTILIGLCLQKEKSRFGKLGLVGVIIGIALLPMSLESLGGVFEPLDSIVAAVMTAWGCWLFWLAVVLFRHVPETIKNDFECAQPARMAPARQKVRKSPEENPYADN